MNVIIGCIIIASAMVTGWTARMMWERETATLIDRNGPPCVFCNNYGGEL